MNGWKHHSSPFLNKVFIFPSPLLDIYIDYQTHFISAKKKGMSGTRAVIQV